MTRNQFTFYRSFFEATQRMRTKKDKAIFYDTLCDYALNGNEPDLDKLPPHIATDFEFIRPVLDTAERRARKMKARYAEKLTQDAIDGKYYVDSI